MSFYARQAYVETEILQADPMRLVQLLYQAALDAVGKARTHVRQGNIAQRSRQITRGMEILVELGQSLDRERGGEVASNLAMLYDYMQTRLQEANLVQMEPPLVEVEGLLSTLQEAWNHCATQPRAEEAHSQTLSRNLAAGWGTPEEPAASHTSLSYAG